jgi:hypothetical protein
MSYRVRVQSHVNRAIVSWNLPDSVFVEIHLRLNTDLANNPAAVLRTSKRPKGMEYRFHMIDPSNRLCQHFFTFHVVYSQDEESMLVTHGAYIRTVGDF